MTEKQASELVEVLKGYFPMMTTVLQAGARKELEGRELTDSLKSAMAAYVRSEDRFVLASFLRAITPTTPGVNVGQVLVDRTRAYIGSIEAEAKQQERQWAEIDAAIDAMSDPELSAAVERAFLNLDVDMSHVVPSQRKRCYLPDGTVNRAGLTPLVKQEIVGNLMANFVRRGPKQ